jgi:hypothetical protein
MNSTPQLSPSRRIVPKNTRRPKQSNKPIQQQSKNNLLTSTDATTNVKKPMRPLTAYHIYFQIEREYIIQTESGPDVSIHENKSYVHDVPRRYRSIKLLPDWYAGPGKKQQKRRHRKSHGKIGFLELSRVISKRWATLESSDPETKRYVSQIAARELEEYKLEMKQYKDLLASVDVSIVSVSTDVADNIASFTPMDQISDLAALATLDTVCSSTSFLVSPTMQPCQPMQRVSSLISLDDHFVDAFYSSEQDEIDYSICSVNTNGHYIPAPGSDLVYPDELVCDPLYELEAECDDLHYLASKRCVSPLSLDMDVEVGAVSDDDFF